MQRNYQPLTKLRFMMQILTANNSEQILIVRRRAAGGGAGGHSLTIGSAVRIPVCMLTISSELFLIKSPLLSTVSLKCPRSLTDSEANYRLWINVSFVIF